MDRKTHVAFGLATVATVASIGLQEGLNTSILGFEGLSILLLPLATFGAKVYDSDFALNRLPKWFPGKKALSLKHRGITHAPVWIIPFYFGLMFLNGMGEKMLTMILLGAVLGCYSHLQADIFNGKGIPLFFPLTKRNYYIARVVTGKASEQVWLMLSFIYLGSLVFSKFL